MTLQCELRSFSSVLENLINSLLLSFYIVGEVVSDSIGEVYFFLFVLPPTQIYFDVGSGLGRFKDSCNSTNRGM